VKRGVLPSKQKKIPDLQWTGVLRRIRIYNRV